MCRGDKRQYGQSQRDLLLVILLEREQEDVDVLLEIQLIVGIFLILTVSAAQEAIDIHLVEVHLMADDTGLGENLTLFVILRHLEDDVHLVVGIEFVDCRDDFRQMAL